MIPQAGDRVKCFFHTGLEVQGTVKSWSSEVAVLVVALNDDNSEELSIIINTARDLLMITIFGKETKAYPPTPGPKPPSEIDLRNKKLADLHVLKMAAEKELLTKKMKSHHIDPDKANSEANLVMPSDFLFRQVSSKIERGRK